MIAEIDVTQELEGCSYPIINIMAKQDKTVPRKASQTIQQTNPDTTTVKLNAPHLLIQTRPSDVWNTIARHTDVILTS